MSSFPFPNAPPNPDNNPFFFFMRPKKRGNINLMPGEENKELEKIVLFNKHHNNNKQLHNSTAIHSTIISKHNTIKESSKSLKDKSKSFSLLPKLGKQIVNNNNIYFGSDLNCFSNGMSKNEWIYIKRQCLNGLRSYHNQIPLILYELNKRKEEHNKKTNNTSLRNYRIERRLSIGNNKTKHGKFIPKDFDLFPMNLQRKSLKTKSLFSGSVTSEINDDETHNNNNIQLNLDFAISIGKKEETDYTKFNYIFLQHLFDINNYYIYGILEGQGFQGTLLARRVKDELVERFSSPKMYQSKGIYPTLDEVYKSLIENDYEGIKNMFNKILLSLQENEFDYTLSGVLINIIIIIKNKLISINIGNIESYLISKRNSNNIEQVVITPLNKVHSTNDIIELDRIENENGVVHEVNNNIKGKGFNDYNESYIEFVNEQFSDNIIYTRVFGFSEVNKIGIINEPEITIQDISNDVQYIILASHYFFDYYQMNYYSRIINTYFEQNKKINPIVIINNIMNISKTKSFEKHNESFKERCIVLITFNFNSPY